MKNNGNEKYVDKYKHSFKTRKRKKHNYQYRKGKMKHDYIPLHNKKANGILWIILDQ